MVAAVVDDMSHDVSRLTGAGFYVVFPVEIVHQDIEDIPVKFQSVFGTGSLESLVLSYLS